MLLIVLVREQHSWQGGWEPLPQSTRQTISHWCGKGKTALSHADGSVWEPFRTSLLAQGELRKSSIPHWRPPGFFVDSRLYQTMSEPRSCHEFRIRVDGFCLQLFCKQQAAAHRSLVTSSELARWPKAMGLLEIVPFWNCSGLTALQNGEIAINLNICSDGSLCGFFSSPILQDFFWALQIFVSWRGWRDSYCSQQWFVS